MIEYNLSISNLRKYFKDKKIITDIDKDIPNNLFTLFLSRLNNINIVK